MSNMEADWARREQDELLMFLRGFDTQGLTSGGSVPAGHEGVYAPSLHEMLEGVRLQGERQIEAVRARSERAAELIRASHQESQVEPTPPSRDLEADWLRREPEELQTFFRQFDPAGLVAGGAIPEGHEGPYRPSPDEVIRGLRVQHESELQALQGRFGVAEELVRVAFQRQEESQ